MWTIPGKARGGFCDGLTRRDFLRVGGLALPEWLRAEDAGRDHWPGASCALLAGGGMRTGQVIGSTNRLGEVPKDRPLTFQNVFATLYRNLGIDPSTTLSNQVGRPMHLLDEFEPIRELI